MTDASAIVLQQKHPIGEGNDDTQQHRYPVNHFFIGRFVKEAPLRMR
jgi:hypothetical protein